MFNSTPCVTVPFCFVLSACVCMHPQIPSLFFKVKNRKQKNIFGLNSSVKEAMTKLAMKLLQTEIFLGSGKKSFLILLSHNTHVRPISWHRYPSNWGMHAPGPILPCRAEVRDKQGGGETLYTRQLWQSIALNLTVLLKG